MDIWGICRSIPGIWWKFASFLRYRVQQRTLGCSLTSQDTDAVIVDEKPCVFGFGNLGNLWRFPNLGRYLKHFKAEKGFNLLNLGPDLKLLDAEKPREKLARLLTLNPWNVNQATTPKSCAHLLHLRRLQAELSYLGVSPARNAKMKNDLRWQKEKGLVPKAGLHTVILIILVVFSSTWCTWGQTSALTHVAIIWCEKRCISRCTYHINACTYKIDGYPHANRSSGWKVNLGGRPWSSWCPFLLRGFGIQMRDGFELVPFLLEDFLFANEVKT